MAGKALEARKLAIVERPYNLAPVGRREEIIGLVEEAVAQAGTHQGGEEHIDYQAVEVVGSHSFAFEHPRNDVVAQYKGHQKAQRIVA